MKTTSKKIATLFVVCLISLTLTGYAYSHWTDILTIFGIVHTGNLEITIYNEKVIPPEIVPVKTLPKNKTVHIYDDITTGWEIWVGIIIKNKGTVPVTINYEITTNNPPYESYFGNEIHFYGPYTTIPPEVWDNINGVSPPPSGEQPTPIDLPVDERLVVWQKITLEIAPPEDFTITITSEYKATLGTWHGEVAVIYYLDKR